MISKCVTTISSIFVTGWNVSTTGKMEGLMWLNWPNMGKYSAWAYIYITFYIHIYIYITLLNQLYEQNGDMLGMGIEGGWNGDTIRIRWWYANNFINDMGVPENKGFTPSLWLVKSLLTSRWNGLSNVRWMTNICGIEWTWRKSNLKGFFTTGWMGSLIQLHLFAIFQMTK